MPDLEYPYSFTIWQIPNSDESILYYTDQIQEQLIAYNLKTNEKRILKKNVPNIMQLKVFQITQDSQRSACLLNNGGCHQICIPSKKSQGGRVCKCSNGLQLQYDGSCVPFKTFMLFTSRFYLRATPFPMQTSSHEALPVFRGHEIAGIDLDFKRKSLVWIEDSNLIKIMNIDPSWVKFNRL